MVPRCVDGFYTQYWTIGQLTQNVYAMHTSQTPFLSVKYIPHINVYQHQQTFILVSVCFVVCETEHNISNSMPIFSESQKCKCITHQSITFIYINRIENKKKSGYPLKARIHGCGWRKRKYRNYVRKIDVHWQSSAITSIERFRVFVLKRKKSFAFDSIQSIWKCMCES